MVTNRFVSDHFSALGCWNRDAASSRLKLVQAERSIIADATVAVLAPSPMLLTLLSAVSHLRIHICENWHDAEAGFLDGQGGCVVLDIDTDRDAKLARLNRCRADWHLHSVIAVSDQDSGEAAMASARAGCSDFVSLAGLSVNWASNLSDSIQRTCLRDMDGADSKQAFRANWNQLSSREQQVLRRFVDGSNSKVVAKELSVSYQTVDKHRNRALKKMNCNSLIDFTRLLYRLQSVVD